MVALRSHIRLNIKTHTYPIKFILMFTQLSFSWTCYQELIRGHGIMYEVDTSVIIFYYGII